MVHRKQGVDEKVKCTVSHCQADTSGANHHFLQNNLEFELRLQEYIELRREERLAEALQHAHKHLMSHWSVSEDEVSKAAGLLAYPSPTRVDRYEVRNPSACILRV